MKERNKKEEEIIQIVNTQTSDSLFIKLSKYKYLSINDILLIRHAILSDVVSEQETIDLLDKNNKLEPVKKYIQTLYSLKQTNE